MIARGVRSADAEARLVRALARHALAAGVAMAVEDCRGRPWSSATFEGVQLRLTVTAGPAEPARRWLATLEEAELPMRGHVAMPPAVDGVYPRADAMAATLTVLVLIDG